MNRECYRRIWRIMGGPVKGTVPRRGEEFPFISARGWAVKFCRIERNERWKVHGRP